MGEVTNLGFEMDEVGEKLLLGNSKTVVVDQES